MEELKEEMGKIFVTPPTPLHDQLQAIQNKHFPTSYKTNTEKEKHILSCCDNFQRQYSLLYRDRKTIFLKPNNECGIEKYVCTTVRPTQLQYTDLYDYDGCAEFVADYLNFTALDPATELPSTLPSPTTVLKRQSGNCFDYSNLLCSLLIGAGYDAYCVSGYSTKEVTLMDETREICPLQRKAEKSESTENKKEDRKYAVRPPKGLKSKYIEKMEAKELLLQKEEEEKRRLEEEARIAELEKPPDDKLYGLRVHCWVLVLAGLRQVPESFFIEALTGQIKTLDHTGYLGIESIWNDTNVWINMQDCSQGVKNVSYDLGDALKWEFMFPNTDKPLVSIPKVNDELLEMDDEEDVTNEPTVDIPPSWVEKIKISPMDYQKRCPLGKKTVIYKKAKLEKFCEYLNKDGLVCKLSIASDNQLQNIIEIQEFYKNRADKMERKVHNLVSGWVTEYYVPGRSQALKEHSYKASSPGPESERVFTFYSSARVDGLEKRKETPNELSETYSGRDDFLAFRQAIFLDRVKKFGPQGSNNRPVGRLLEKFQRNVKKSADKDIAERAFLVADDRISIKFHLETQKITASTREFMKPPNFSFDKSFQLNFSLDFTNAFLVNPDIKPEKELEIYDMMVDLLHGEKKCLDKIRESEDETREILQERLNEEATSELLVSVYDTERNEKAKLRRTELEIQQKEDEMRKRDMELDYLAPFLARIGNPEKLTRNDAFKVKDECLNDLKQRLIDKANLIQARFEKETSELQTKQAWYQENQMNMTKEDEEDYLNFCSEAMFRIHILELRLNRHKEMAPHKYMQLDDKLRKDYRLSDLVH